MSKVKHIIIEINGTEYQMSMNEARQLWGALNEVFYKPASIPASSYWPRQPYWLESRPGLTYRAAATSNDPSAPVVVPKYKFEFEGFRPANKVGGSVDE